MTLVQLLTFNIALMVAIASPGPALLMAIQTSLSAGRTAGIAIGVGLGLMAATWTMMALLGLVFVFQLFPVVFLGAKITGAAYLLFISYKMWTDTSTPINAQINRGRNAFCQGLLVNLLNPKSVLFAAAVLVTVFPNGISIVDSFVIVANHFLVEVTFYTTLALSMNTQVVAKRYLNSKIYIDRCAAAVLGALGIRLLLDRGNVS